MIRDAGYDQSLFLSRPLVSRSLTDLVHRLACNGDVVRQTPDQLTVFQGGPSRTGGRKRPYLNSHGPSEQRRKTADSPRPGGLD